MSKQESISRYNPDTGTMNKATKENTFWGHIMIAWDVPSTWVFNAAATKHWLAIRWPSGWNETDNDGCGWSDDKRITPPKKLGCWGVKQNQTTAIKTQTKPTAVVAWSVGLHIGKNLTTTEQNGMLIVFEQAFTNFISLPMDDGQVKRCHVSLWSFHFRAGADCSLPVMPSSLDPAPKGL